MMRYKQHGLVIILAAVAGFIGGMISNRIVDSGPAFAETKQTQQKLVVAQEFRVVDKFGNTIGSFGIPPHLKDIEVIDSPAGSKKSHQIAQLRLGNNSTVILTADGEDGHIKIGSPDSHIALYATGHYAHMAFMLQTAHNLVSKIRLTTQKGTNISLQDDKGNERILIGNTAFVTAPPAGKTGYPISSITLFNEKNDAAWSVSR